MPFVNQPAQESPAEQQKLLIAVGSLISELSKLLYPAATPARIGTVENVLYTIWLRLLQTARSIEAASLEGYAHEQQALARTMVNAASDLIFIANQQKPVEWAVLYAIFSIERRAAITTGYVKAGVISKQQGENWDAEASEKERAVMAEFEQRGIKPATKQNQHRKRPPQTWSGLTDREMIGKVGRGWYEVYYVPFSDAAHASILTAEEELRQIQAGKVIIGPRYLPRPLLFVTVALADTLLTASGVIDSHFKLGRANALAAEDRAMRNAVDEYRGTLPPGDFEPAEAS
jgi:Family of unknown function (DUF5677)